MTHKGSKKKSFQFIDADPSSVDDATKAKRRRLVRSNAANYQWSQTKPSRLLVEPKNRKELTPSSDDGSVIALGVHDEKGLAAEEVVTGTGYSADLALDSNNVLSVAQAGEKSFCREESLEPQTSLIVRNPWFSLQSLSTLASPEDIATLMRFNVQYVLPNLLPEIRKGVVNPASPQWMQLAMSSPTLFNTWMHCGALHHQVVRGVYRFASKDILSNHLKVIQLLNEEMQDPVRACSDENILAVSGMASYGWEGSSRKGGQSPSQGPLRSLQGLNDYSSMTAVPLHVEGLSVLVAMRGGLENIEMEGLAPMLSYSGIMEATRNLTLPRYPFMPLVKSLEAFKSMEKTAEPSLGFINADFGFPLHWQYSEFPLLCELYSVLKTMDDYTTMVHNHIEGISFQESLATMADCRNYTQHSLMSLPEYSESQPNFLAGNPYEATRLAATVYSLLVVFPIATSSAPFDELADRLRTVLELSHDSISDLNLLVWILTMGAIAATDSHHRSWFVSALRTVLESVSIGSWDDLKAILQSFLWLPSTSDADGLSLWLEAVQLPLVDKWGSENIDSEYSI